MDMSFNSTNSSDSFLLLLLFCSNSRLGIIIFMSFCVSYILFVLPLIFFVIYLGLKQRRKRSRSRAATMSHSDFFTYNVIGLELITMSGSCLYSYGAYIGEQTLQLVGVSICSVTSPGQTLFHLLTCVERYMAVVHPITYLGLKEAGGVRIRNISAVCIWLLCFVLMGFSKFLSRTFGPIIYSCLLVFSLIIVSFCSFSVLRVLNHSGPAQGSGDRERVNQAKQRAFYTIVAIMIALLFRFVGGLVSNITFNLYVMTLTRCALGSSAICLTLPCSLVLPLLFLQRAGKLPNCTNTTQKQDKVWIRTT